MKKQFQKLVILGTIMLLATAAHATTYTFTSYDGNKEGTNNTADLQDLNHAQNYTWGINAGFLKGETITSATIKMAKIYDWQVESYRLALHLMDSPLWLKNNGVWQQKNWSQMYTSSNSAKENTTNGEKYQEFVKVLSDTDGGTDFFTNYPNMNTGTNILLNEYLQKVTTSCSGKITVTTPGEIPDTKAEAVDVFYTFSAGELAKLNTFLADGIFGLGFDPDCHFYNDGISFIVETKAPVPEPSTFALLGLGMVGAGLLRRRMKK